jgi:P-type Ca2+ transporter type 2C
LPGRIRVEIPELYRNPFLCHRMEKYFTIQPGIREVKANPLTGRFLIVFDHEQQVAVQGALKRIVATIRKRGPVQEPVSVVPVDAADQTARDITVLRHRERAAHTTVPPQLKSQFLHVGITGAILTTLLAKRMFYGRSLLADSPYLFNLTAATTIVSGYPILRDGLQHLTKKGRVSHDLLISMATITLLAMRENLAGLSILWILHLSSLFRTIMLEYSRRSIYRMIAGKQQHAWILRQGKKVKVSVQHVQPGDEVIVHAGERVAVDGEVILGTANVNQSAITGEFLPTTISVGQTLYAGSVVEAGLVHVLARHVGKDTSVARVLQLVQQAERSKASITGLAEQYSQRLVPVTLGLAGLVYFFTRDFNRTLAMLIIGCPAAITLSTQTALGMAVGKAASEGILVKNTGVLEEISQIDTVLFDKTGTLTMSQPKITEIVPIVKTFSEDRLLVLAASAEVHTDHPLAHMLTREAELRGLKLMQAGDEASLGKDVRAAVEGSEILVGNEELMREEKVDLRRAKANALRMQHLGSGVVYVAHNRRIIGLIGIRDTLRPESAQALNMLRSEGVEHIGLITGDSLYAANSVAQQLGITESWSSCLPGEKVAIVEDLHRNGRRIVMVGDGINDSPALAAADIGIAMGVNGTEAAMETADVVLNSDDPRGIASLIHLSKQSLEIVRQNLAIGVGLNVVGLALGAARLISPVTAALVQNLSTLAVVANSARILRKKRPAILSPGLDLQTFAHNPYRLTPPLRVIPGNKETRTRSWQNSSQSKNPSWHTLKIEEVCERQAVNATQGLNSREVISRLMQVGRNKLLKAQYKGFWPVFFDQFKDIMVQVLLGACGVSIMLGRTKDALITAAIVLANAFLGTMQEKRAEQSMDALQKLAAPIARVIRDGHVYQVVAEKLVPGDVIILEAGDRVPADCRLLEAANLEVEESSLTGENLPVRKHIRCLEDDSLSLGDRKNMVFMGTSVTRGRAKAIVVATGMATEMGYIAGMIQEVQFEQTPLQKRLKELGRYLVYGCLGIAGLIFVAGILRGETVLNMLQTSASLAVAAIPEGLTTIVIIALAMGVQRMTKRNIIVRRMASIETLGCTTVICSDKTGTITKNEMTVRSLYLGGEWFKFSGEGYTPQGQVFLEGQPVVQPEQMKALQYALTVGVLCNNAVLNKTISEPLQAQGEKTVARRKIAWNINGDPTEGALLVAGAKVGLWSHQLNQHHPRLREIPFESERRMMSVVACKDGEEPIVYSKGAPDNVLSRCTRLWKSNGDIAPLTEQDHQQIYAANAAMTQEAMRVLALAYREVPVGETDAEVLEEDLVFVGLIGMIDPPRPEVFEAVAKCHKAGVKIVMITGDHPNTAAAIAREIGILQGEAGVLTGCQLDAMDDLELLERVEKISVYARTSPQHKLRIIQALKSKNYIVAMTGDGVNDAPAVKAADVGIAMGRMGTDVTNEAAAMTLTDDNFATIVIAMEEGRSIYNNIRKAIRYLLATNIGEVVLMFLAVLLGMPLPLIPIQLLWINFVGDGLPAIALVNDPPAENIMSQPPRSGDESVFAGGLGKKIMSRGLAIGVGTLALYAWKLGVSGSVLAARTLTLASLSIGQFIHIFDCRNERFTGRVGLFSNPYLIGAVALSMTMVIGVIHLPICQPLFQTVALGPLDWGIALGGAALTAGLDILFERYIVSRQFVFPLPEPKTCEQILH